MSNQWVDKKRTTHVISKAKEGNEKEKLDSGGKARSEKNIRFHVAPNGFLVIRKLFFFIKKQGNGI